jgi:hypothetical protein
VKKKWSFSAKTGRLSFKGAIIFIDDFYTTIKKRGKRTEMGKYEEGKYDDQE